MEVHARLRPEQHGIDSVSMKHCISANNSGVTFLLDRIDKFNHFTSYYMESHLIICLVRPFSVVFGFRCKARAQQNLYLLNHNILEITSSGGRWWYSDTFFGWWRVDVLMTSFITRVMWASAKCNNHFPWLLLFLHRTNNSAYPIKPNGDLQGLKI